MSQKHVIVDTSLIISIEVNPDITNTTRVHYAYHPILCNPIEATRLHSALYLAFT